MPSEYQPLPWQRPQWRTLVAQRRTGRPAHALLLAGAAGLGKQRFARLFSQALLCTQPAEPDHIPCGRCNACRLFRAGTHPDCLQVGPAEEGKAIVVDQARELVHFFSLTPQLGPCKIAIVAPADALNRNAINSLLKTLEEPAGDALLLLVSEQPGLLPATVRSRCQAMGFTPPAREMALAWLQDQDVTGAAADVEGLGSLLELAGGAPLRALELAKSGGPIEYDAMAEQLCSLVIGRAEPVTTAAIWLKSGAKATLYWMYQVTLDAIRLHFTAAIPRLVSLGGRPRIEDVGRRVGRRQLFAIHDQIIDAMRAIRGQVNQELLLDTLAVSWAQSMKPNGTFTGQGPHRESKSGSNRTRSDIDTDERRYGHRGTPRREKAAERPPVRDPR